MVFCQRGSYHRKTKDLHYAVISYLCIHREICCEYVTFILSLKFYNLEKLHGGTYIYDKFITRRYLEKDISALQDHWIHSHSSNAQEQYTWLVLCTLSTQQVYTSCKGDQRKCVKKCISWERREVIRKLAHFTTSAEVSVSNLQHDCIFDLEILPVGIYLENSLQMCKMLYLQCIFLLLLLQHYLQ